MWIEYHYKSNSHHSSGERYITLIGQVLILHFYSSKHPLATNKKTMKSIIFYRALVLMVILQQIAIAFRIPTNSRLFSTHTTQHSRSISSCLNDNNKRNLSPTELHILSKWVKVVASRVSILKGVFLVKRQVGMGVFF